MKSPYKIAKELNVSPQAVYKRMSEQFNNEFNNHIQRTTTGQYKLDDVAERALKALFNQVVEPVEDLVVEPVEQLNESLLNQMNSENSFLRARVESLEEELKTERTHSREQADKLSDLAAQLAELTRNNQLLLGAEQSRTNPALLPPNLGVSTETPKEAWKKKGFFKKMFKKRA